MTIFVFLFLLWCTPLTGTIAQGSGENIYDVLSNIIESAIVSATLSLSSFLADCLISSKVKDKLVGLVFIPRPGETIFSRIKYGADIDDRFLVEDAQKRYDTIISNLPVEKSARRKYENAKWYKIYQSHQDKGQVKQSQKDSLVCRDLYVQTILFSILYFLSLVIFRHLVIFSQDFVVVLVVVAITTNCATHVKMNRFVNTVIAVDLASGNR